MLERLACTREASSGNPVRQSKPASTTCSISTSFATLPASLTPRLRYLRAPPASAPACVSQAQGSLAELSTSCAVRLEGDKLLSSKRKEAVHSTTCHPLRSLGSVPGAASTRGAHRVPAKWRERRAMSVTVRACPSTARLRRCQKPCTSGVTQASLPTALRRCLHMPAQL